MDKKQRWPRTSVAEMYADVFKSNSAVIPIIEILSSDCLGHQHTTESVKKTGKANHFEGNVISVSERKVVL